MECGPKTRASVRPIAKLEDLGYGKDSTESMFLNAPEELHRNLLGALYTPPSTVSVVYGVPGKFGSFVRNAGLDDSVHEVTEILSHRFPSVDPTTIQSSIGYALKFFDAVDTTYHDCAPPGFRSSLDGNSLAHTDDLKIFAP
jgi:hypothetical protein